MKNSHIRMASIGLVTFSLAACAGVAGADGPQSPRTTSPTAPVPAPAMPPDLARSVQAITDTVLENHIDPPARQQMILSGIKALHRAARLPEPLGLGRRVSAVTTPEQLAALLQEVWPKTITKAIEGKSLEESLLEGLVAAVPGGAELMSAKESKVAESMAGNRYVGIHITLAMDDKAKRPAMSSVFKGGPADRAGIKDGALIEEVDGADTKGMKLRDVVDRLRGDEGTDVVVKVRQPKETTSRTIKITRGQLPHATIVGIHEHEAGDSKLQLEGLDPIGYLKITEITASTPHELRKLARRMESEGIRALVLDLRGHESGGHAVHPAVLLADSLLERGMIGRVRTARGVTTYQADPDALFRGWPIAVLVDQNTTGTAEWLAAALQDNRRAVVVGIPTSGAHRRRGVPPGEFRLASALPQVEETGVRSMVPVGDGRWSITMATGYLERGDGRPLTDRDGAAPDDSSEGERPRGGVQPDHPTFGRTPADPARTRNADRLAYNTARKPAEGAGPGNDPVLTAAAAILKKALEKP